MTASTPTILATSGGLKAGRRIPWELNKLTEYAIELSGVTGRAPRVCFLATAQGDSTATIANFYNEESLLIYAASVDEYRLRALNQAILNTINHNGGCSPRRSSHGSARRPPESPMSRDGLCRPLRRRILGATRTPFGGQPRRHA